MCSGVCVASILCTADARACERLRRPLDRLRMHPRCLEPLTRFWASRGVDSFNQALRVLQEETLRAPVPSDWGARSVPPPSAVLDYLHRPVQERIIGMVDPCNMLL